MSINYKGTFTFSELCTVQLHFEEDLEKIKSVYDAYVSATDTHTVIVDFGLIDPDSTLWEYSENLFGAFNWRNLPKGLVRFVLP